MADRALVRILAPHFVAGIEIEWGVVVRAAPILRYAVGWSASKASAYFRDKGWRAHYV